MQPIDPNSETWGISAGVVAASLAPEAPATPAPLTDAELDTAIAALLQEHVKPELSSVEKQTQYLRMRETDFYYRGIQDLEVINQGGLLDFQPIVTQTVQQDDYRVNVIRAYDRKYVPAIGSRPWHNAKVVPEDTANERDRKAARLAETLILWFKQVWNIRKLSLQIPHHNFKDGTVFAHLSYVADEGLFGTSEVPIEREVEKTLEPDRWECACGNVSENPLVDEIDGLRTCPACGAAMGQDSFRPRETAMVPEQIGTKTYPNAGPVVRLYTGYEVTVPFFSRQIDRVPYLVLEYKEHKSELFRVFGKELREKMRNATAGGGESQLGDQYREAKSSPSGTPSSTIPTSHWKYRATWIQPWTLELVEDERIREGLKQKYPKGLKVSEVEDKIVRKEDKSLGAEWVAIQAEVSEFLHTDPYGYCLLELQELINIFWTVAVAFSQRKLPSVVADVNMGIADRINNSQGLSMEVIETSALYGRGVNDGLGIIPTPQGEVSQFISFINLCDQYIQLLSGLKPEIFGAGEKQATAEAARNALNQALAMLSPAGELMSQGYAEMYRKAIDLILQNAATDFQVSVKNPDGSRVTEMVDIRALKDGHFQIEAEAGVPMSWAERRTQLNEIITQNPALAQAMSLDQPINLPVVRDYLLSGMGELRVPQEDMREKVLAVIQLLLEQQPIENPDGSLSSSILPEDFVDKPEMSGIVHAWCLSPGGQAAREKNPAGYRNVVLHGQALEILGMPLPGPAIPGQSADGSTPPPPDLLSPDQGAGPSPAQAPPEGQPADLPPVQ